MKKALKWFFFSYIWLGALLLGIDIATKLAVSLNMEQGSAGAIEIIKGFVNIEYVQNTAAAFGMGFSDPNINRVLYIIIAFVGIGIITAVYVLKFKKLKCFVKACLMMIGFGALGNLIDRLFYAQSSFYVVDWINFYGIWDFHFNIADSAIVVGVIMLVVWLIVDEVKDYIKNKPAKVESKEKVLSSEEQRRQDEFAVQSDEETSK